MKLFQYWDTGQPPDEVAGWIEGFRVKNPNLEHRLYDRDTASWFIRKNLGPREQRAFDACAVPSMQANYFRLSAVLTKGGFYADADLQCLESLKSLRGLSSDALLLVWNGAMTNSFLMFRQRQDPFLAACLTLATENIEARRFDTSYASTGPAILNAIRAALDPSWMEAMHREDAVCRELKALAHGSVARPKEVRESIAALTLTHFLAADRWIGTEQPAYKTTSRHWLNWKGSIYLEAS